ncbi:MAG: hypothetical protein OEY23_02015 [Acidimicrobiia bacterium]|nr:hypothetical protein [Acidimicrobiia bacterium]
MAADQLYAASDYPVRADLAEAHDAWLDHVAGPGTWWTGEQRVAFVAALWAALDDPDPLPPWSPPSTEPGRLPDGWPLPPAAFDMAYRLARHAATTTESWYRGVLDGLDAAPEAYVELAALAATGLAVGTFGPALGLARPALRAAQPGDPSRQSPPVAPAELNWVPVAGEPDARPAVVQAFSAVPAEHAIQWRLAGAQYMTTAQMAELDWQRPDSPLHRRQMELVAARLSLHRECFY